MCGCTCARVCVEKVAHMGDHVKPQRNATTNLTSADETSAFPSKEDSVRSCLMGCQEDGGFPSLQTSRWLICEILTAGEE